MTSSHAKNHFGAVLSQLKNEPVAIERHGKPIAFLVPAHQRPANQEDAARREARLIQSGIDKDRLVRHLRVATALLSAKRPAAKAMLARAHALVDRWERDRLCSRDYVERWRNLLDLPIPQLAQEMCGDAGGWGTALRQNSPWR